MRRYFAFFIASGFCGLIYETVWLRLYMAQFGVTSISLAIVVSCFMAGMALGAWLISKLGDRLERLELRGALRAYAAAEACIGLAGLLVPHALRLGGNLVSVWAVGRGSGAELFATGVWTSLTLLPVCSAMGMTLPLGMLALRREPGVDGSTSFSFLYVANVLGAALGTLLSAFVLIELEGFANTLVLAAALNFGVAALAFGYSAQVSASTAPAPTKSPGATREEVAARGERSLLWLLFATGFCSMGMEVIWIRQFTFYLGTVVYSFATILACYLVATVLGSQLYRRHAARSADASNSTSGAPWAWVGLCGLLPLLLADHRLFAFNAMHGGMETGQIGWSTALRACIGVAPVSFALGYLTPRLVDRWSGGFSGRAGLAYSVNTIGCILGPLAAGFLLLPFFGERPALALLTLPFFLAAAIGLVRSKLNQDRALVASAALASLLIFLFTQGFEEQFPKGQVMRDQTATSIATGEGRGKRLLVNGVGITVMVPATKVMAHLPLAILGRPAERALVICFGMGTTFRAVRSWGVPTTAVELVPGVPKLFGYFFADGPALLNSPDVHLVIDDGRRFLQSTSERYDLITIDPPPPLEAASSSLLYSKEFYVLVKGRLKPGGILQQWFPGGELAVLGAFARALTESFPYVVAYRSFGGFGLHMLASDQPIAIPTAAVLAMRVPPAAAKDLLEWGPRETVEDQFSAILEHPVDLRKLLEVTPEVEALHDDQPLNEYYFLRRLAGEPAEF